MILSLSFLNLRSSRVCGQSGTRGALTGVGLSIGYPAGSDVSPAGLLVISSAPGGPASRAGILSGDVILAIDEASTESMGIYDAAERLQGPDGSSVELTIRSGPDIKHLALTRERVSLNPVKSRLCAVPGSGKDFPKIGYIKLASFNQNASGILNPLSLVKRPFGCWDFEFEHLNLSVFVTLAKMTFGNYC